MFHDLNNDGVKDPGEPGIASWTVYQDFGSWGNGQRDPNEPIAVSDESGAYTLTLIPAPKGPALLPSAIREIPQPDWVQTYPASGQYNIQYNSTRIAGQPNLDFGNFKLIQLPPRVTQVYFSGSAWGAPFKQYLESTSIGSARFGYAVPAGVAQLDVLPWTNLNQVSITFDQDVQADFGDLQVRGVNTAVYALDPPRSSTTPPRRPRPGHWGRVAASPTTG